MTLNHVARRLHVYLAMALLPWFLVYGVSSLAIQHPGLFQAGGAQTPPWESLWERPASVAIPDDPDWRQVGADILREAGHEGLFWIDTRDAARPRVTRFDFWSNARYTYDSRTQTMTAEAQPVNLRMFIVRLHFRGGWVQESFLNDLWAVVVDIVQVGFLLWVATGLYMWWLLPATRRWGLVALAGGFLSFAGFMAVL